MISRVERGESSPSATILGRLAAALGVPLAQLLTEEAAPPQRLRRRDTQEVWCDPALGYLRRQVAPRNPYDGVELVEVELPVAARVSYPRWSGAPYRQRLWLLSGQLRIHYGEQPYELEHGDCLDFSLDQPITFEALGGERCRYLLVSSSD
jgi:transcriptional regulator with XRE-family HTH domain